jgi:dethiobiotin synthetase
MAAAALGRPPFTIGDLAAETRFPEGTDVGIVETAGGVRSPQADDGDAVDLVLALDPDHVVLVADAGLGTIHAVRTSVEPLEPRWPIVVLNRYDDLDDLHRANRRWLTDRYGIDVVTSPIAVAERIDLGVTDRSTHVPGDVT